jgi:hypothetical protein
VQEQKGDAADRQLSNHHIEKELTAAPAPDDDLEPVKQALRRLGGPVRKYGDAPR